MTTSDRDRLGEALAARFQDGGAVDTTLSNATLAGMAARRVIRSYTDQPLSDGLLQMLAAVALSSPSKSDLQQRDIVIVRDAAKRNAIAGMIDNHPWLATAPAILVFCGNNRRQRLLHEWRGHEFANDHLDVFFNAAVDAGIALQAFITAAESVGLGCCPLSTIRNRAEEVSRLIELPRHVFPVAGLAVGWPANPGRLSPRLPLGATVHRDRYSEGDDLRATVEGYDRWRAERLPYRTQREPERFGTVDNYGWSEEKARQYARPERADFGQFVRARGFRLD